MKTGVECRHQCISFIYSLCKDVSSSNNMPPNCMAVSSKGYGRKRSCPVLRHCYWVCLLGPRKATINLWVAGPQAEIWTLFLPKGKQECQPLGCNSQLIQMSVQSGTLTILGRVFVYCSSYIVLWLCGHRFKNGKCFWKMFLDVWLK